MGAILEFFVLKILIRLSNDQILRGELDFWAQTQYLGKFFVFFIRQSNKCDFIFGLELLFFILS